MPETQLSALVGLLETIVDPAFEDEEISEDEEAAVAHSRSGSSTTRGFPLSR